MILLSDIPAEQQVIGALLLKPDGYLKIAHWLSEEDFHNQQHQTIYRVFSDRFKAGKSVDWLSLIDALDARENTSPTRAALDDCLNSTVTSAALVHDARKIKQAFQRRKLIETAETLRALARKPNENLDDLINDAQNAMLTCFRPPVQGEQFVELIPKALMFCETASRQSDQQGIRTGIQAFDSLTGGLQRGQVVVVAARVAMGKTSLALHIARAAGKAGAKVLFVSLEMTATELAVRAIAAESGLAFTRLWTGQAQEQIRIQRDAAEILATHQITVLELGHTTMPAILQMAKAHAMMHGLDLLIIDNMNLVHGAHEYRSMSENSRLTKVGAKDLNVPILAVYQLKRETDERIDGRPSITDLKQSGQIEADADLVLLAYRKNYYERKRLYIEPAEIIVAKNRNGPTGIVNVTWMPITMSFLDRPCEEQQELATI